MDISSIKGVSIEAMAAAVPCQKVDNRLFAREHFPQQSFDSTISAIGVEERRICRKPDTTSLDLGVVAAKKILQSGVKPEEIGAVVCVTLTPDALMPNNASYAQTLLGLPTGIVAFDINHACSGFVYGLWNAALICQNLNKKVLLLNGDVNSHYVSPWDKSTALLFGDAATATLLAPCEASPAWNFAFHTDASRRDAIQMNLGFRHPLEKDDLEYRIFEDGSRRRFIDMQMDGQAVFDYVVMQMPVFATAFMDELETAAEEYEALLLHQANAFMMKKIARRLGFPLEKLPLCIRKYGNTSSASIPLCICSELEQHPADKVLMLGMGAGLAAAIADLSLKGMRNLGVSTVDL